LTFSTGIVKSRQGPELAEVLKMANKSFMVKGQTGKRDGTSLKMLRSRKICRKHFIMKGFAILRNHLNRI
jgi:hypothetical protein